MGRIDGCCLDFRSLEGHLILGSLARWTLKEQDRKSIDTFEHLCGRKRLENTTDSQ